MELNIGHLVEQQVKGHFTFQAGQRGTYAKVNSRAEGEVSIVLPGNIESIGFGKFHGIAVGGTNHSPHPLSLLDLFTAHLEILCCQSRDPLYRSVVSQAFFDCRADQTPIFTNPLELFRMFQQCQQTIAQQTGGCFVSCKQQKYNHGMEFFFAELLARLDCRRQSRNQIVFWVLAPLGNQLTQVVLQ